MARVVKWNDACDVDLEAYETSDAGGVLLWLTKENDDDTAISFYCSREDWQQIRAHIDGLFAAMESKKGGE